MYRYYEPLYRYYEPLYRYMLICIDTFLYRMHVLVLAWSSIDTWGLVSIQRLMYRYIYMLYRYKGGHFKFLARLSIVSIHEDHASIHLSKIVIFSCLLSPDSLDYTIWCHIFVFTFDMILKPSLTSSKYFFRRATLSLGDHRPLFRLYSRLLKISPDKIRCLQINTDSHNNLFYFNDWAPQIHSPH